MANREGLINESINLFMRLTGLEKEDAQELINDYFDQLPKLLTDFEALLATSDFLTMTKKAHQLKGTSGNLRIMPLYELVVQLEKSAMLQDSEACGHLLKMIKDITL